MQLHDHQRLPMPRELTYLFAVSSPLELSPCLDHPFQAYTDTLFYSSLRHYTTVLCFLLYSVAHADLLQIS